MLAYILEQLRKSDLEEAELKQRFYLLRPDKKIFAAEVMQLEDERTVRIIYGWDYLYNTPDAEDSLKLIGGFDCKRRFKADICDMEDWRKTVEEIKSNYAHYDKYSKEEILEESRELRKQFMSRITAKLKPLGFRKKSNWWKLRVGEEWSLEFTAEKSSYCDEYSFDTLLKRLGEQNEFRGCCFSKCGTPTGEQRYDWQIHPVEMFDEFMDEIIETYILPMIQMEPEELKKMPWMQKGCRRRLWGDICEDCWNENNYCGE